MCELFGLSARRRLDGRTLPLAHFGARGGCVADNPDGWGIAWRDGAALRLEKEPIAACRSLRFESLLRSWGSDLAIAHVRKARHPPINSLVNTHPFLHACCGRRWVFAHNGLVPGIIPLERARGAPVCRPEGETDSEFAFCHLLAQVTQGFHSPAWLGALAEDSAAIARLGQFNFLLSDGEHLFAYGHDRLHYLEHEGFAMIATEPLTAHPDWRAFAPGELRIYRQGRWLKAPAPAGASAATTASALPRDPTPHGGRPCSKPSP